MTIIFIKKNKKDIKNKLKRPVSKLCKKQVKLKYKSHTDKSLQTDCKKWPFLLFLVPILASFSQISMTLWPLYVHKVYKKWLFLEKSPFLAPKIKRPKNPKNGQNPVLPKIVKNALSRIQPSVKISEISWFTFYSFSCFSEIPTFSTSCFTVSLVLYDQYLVLTQKARPRPTMDIFVKSKGQKK